MDCPYRDAVCYFANDRRRWDISFGGQPVELGTIECTLPSGVECPQDIDPSDDCEDEEPDPASIFGG